MRCLFLFTAVALQPTPVFCSSSSSSHANSRAWSPLLAISEDNVVITSTIQQYPNNPSYFSIRKSQHSTANLSTAIKTLRGGAGTAGQIPIGDSGGGGENFVQDAYDWCINLGAPAALVAGAVVATLYENVREGALIVLTEDGAYGRFAKRFTNFLLLSAFALQIVSIFVTTVTGTMLLSRDQSTLKTQAGTALGFLREHYEFEYMTSRITFLQGLLNWIAAVAFEFTIPNPDHGPATKRMNEFIASALFTLLFLIVAFYNNHMTFYANYFQMLSRWLVVTAKRFFLQWPPRPMAIFLLPSLIYTFYAAYHAFTVQPTRVDFEKEEDVVRRRVFRRY